MITTVETRVHYSPLTAVEVLVTSRVELAMKSVNVSSGHGVGSDVLDPDQRDLSGNTERPQMNVFNRIVSHSDLNRIDKIPGKSTAEGSGSLVMSTKDNLTCKRTLITQ